MQDYIVRLKTDTGRICCRFRVNARNEEAAKQMIMAAEHCPESDILSIKVAAYPKKKNKKQ